MKWTQYLKQSKISEDVVLDGNKQAIILNNRAEEEQRSRGIIKFNKNSKKIEKSWLGALETVKPVNKKLSRFLSMQSPEAYRRPKRESYSTKKILTKLNSDTFLL